VPARRHQETSHETGVPHILMKMFKARAGVDMVHVAYKNIPEAYQGVLSGDTVAVMDQPATAGPHLRRCAPGSPACRPIRPAVRRRRSGRSSPPR